MSKCVCVIGAGVCGLSAALHVQEIIPDAAVTIVTEHVSPDTTGDVSAGFWQPHLLGNTPLTKVRRWSEATFEYLTSVIGSADAALAGAFFVSGYTLFREKVEDPWWADIPIGYRHMTDRELALHPGFKFGDYSTRVLVDVQQYLPWLHKRFLNKGGKLIKRKITKFDELKQDYDVVMNCTGIGARDLCNDTTVIPVQGQTMRVHAPWIKHFLITEQDIHIFPSGNSVILGGSHSVGIYDRNINLSEKERILKACCKMVPSLKHARHLSDWAGLRPTRPEVRLEREDIVSGGHVIKVVHNYGHGGSGITVHWGCAQDAAKLVSEALGEKYSARL